MYNYIHAIACVCIYGGYIIYLPTTTTITTKGHSKHWFIAVSKTILPVRCATIAVFQLNIKYKVLEVCEGKRNWLNGTIETEHLLLVLHSHPMERVLLLSTN